MTAKRTDATMPPRTDVVYIAGYGRSGSTLLDLLLGRLDGWFSMGEFRLFWHAARDHWRCGCGSEVESCDVWSKVLAAVAPADRERVLALIRTTLRTRRVPGLVVPPLLGSHRAARDELAGIVGTVYPAVARIAGARVLVDSSKDPVYGLVLAGVPNLRVHVVHLVRDSRAVAWSWQRKRLRPEIGSTAAYMPVRSAVRTSLDWDLRNGLAHVLGRRAASYTRLTYETLVRDPDAAVAMVARRVDPGVSLPANPANRGNHTVAGNPMRFGTGEISVTPDMEWRDALDPRDRRVVSALTWPLRRTYGYE